MTERPLVEATWGVLWFGFFLGLVFGWKEGGRDKGREGGRDKGREGGRERGEGERVRKPRLVLVGKRDRGREGGRETGEREGGRKERASK